MGKPGKKSLERCSEGRFVHVNTYDSFYSGATFTIWFHKKDKELALRIFESKDVGLVNIYSNFIVYFEVRIYDKSKYHGLNHFKKFWLCSKD